MFENEEQPLNSFERLQKEFENDFKDDHKENIKTGVWSILGTFRYIGQIVDMYVPKSTYHTCIDFCAVIDTVDFFFAIREILLLI